MFLRSLIRALCILDLPAVLTPLTSATVRYRASYSPKPPPTESEVTGPLLVKDEHAVSPTFISVVKKIRELQGWRGFYRGWAPTMLFFVLIQWFIPYNMTTHKVWVSPSPATTYKTLQTAFLSAIVYTIPLTVVYRTIVNIQPITFKRPKEAIRVLFTTYERRMPLVIYATPGLVPAILLQIVPRIIFIHPIRNSIQHSFQWSIHRHAQPILFLFLEYGCVALLNLLTTVIFAPLDVMITRLVIQRNYGGLPVVDLPETELPTASVDQIMLPEKELEVTGEIQVSAVRVIAEEPPVRYACGPLWLFGAVLTVVFIFSLRSSEYLGLWDCFQKIREEEGWGVLYRMAWLTFVGDMLRM